MELKNYFAQDPAGNIIPLPTGYLYLPDGVTLATGLQDATGAALSNPFTGTAQGQFQIAAPDGNYNLRIVGAGRDFTMAVRFIDAAGVVAALAAKVDGPGALAASVGTGSTQAPSRSVLAASGGSSLMGFLQAGTSASTQTIQNRLRRLIYVTDFGAVGDGPTDDTAAIQAAFTYAATLVAATYYIGQNVKPTVIFPQGMQFGITAQVTCVNGVEIDMQSPIVVSAAASAGQSWLKIGTTTNTQGTRNGRLVLDVIRATASDWSNSADVGIEIQGFAGGDIYIRRAIGFTNGVIEGAGGNCFGYNRIYYGELRGNKYPVTLTCDTGYFNNQNQHFGGSFTCIGEGVAGVSRYGFRFKTSSISGYQEHVFNAPSFELGLTSAQTGNPSAEAVPLLIEGPAADIVVHDPRSEHCSDVKVKITNASVGRVEWNERFTQRASASWPGITGGGISDGSSFQTNKVRNYMDELLKDALLIWDSGEIGLRTNQYDGSTGYAPGGFDICDSAYSLFAGNNSIVPSGNILTFTAGGRNLVRQIDTSMNKRFIVLVNTGDATKNWFFNLKPFDSSGTLLSDNPTIPHVIGEDASMLSWNAGSVGGAYTFTGATYARAFYFSVDSLTKSLALIFGSYNGAQIRSMQIYALDAPCSTWATKRSGKADTDRIATAVPTTGTWQRGDWVWNVAPAIASGKVLLGWSRLTTGSGNTAGTDWTPLYATTS